MKSKVNKILALLFCAGVMLVCVMTLITSGRNFAYGFFKSYTDQLDENSDVFDNISARIYKLNYNAEYRLWGRDELRHLSALSQMLPGRELVNVADYDMVKLTNGSYYNVSNGAYDGVLPGEYIVFAGDIKEKYGAETMLVYCHCGLYEDGLMPGDSDTYDNNNEYADMIIADFEKAGIPVTDSRESYRSSGLTIQQAINKSDVHWTHLMALYTAFDAAKTLRDAGFDVDPETLDPANFDYDLYPKLLSGEFARRVGERYVECDDVYVLYPKYETHFMYEELGAPESQKTGS
ncbi:MAG: hypothetical protein II920_04055, partial [Clostridia bacterium]|nr:hypothetical protein [Clostridia bacterium]